jgi:pimeloyl-ACP methyl ester carboxylesterase
MTSWGEALSRVCRRALLIVLALAALGLIAYTQLPGIGAGALLHPHRTAVRIEPPAGCNNVTFAGGAGALRGWRCPAVRDRIGTLVYLHGVADNRSSGAGILTRFAAQGFDAVAYDSRAHGESDGSICTYGYFEKDDLQRVLDAVGAGPVVLIGNSLGAAVALQHASRDPRVRAVIAVEAFSDLRTVATERAPFIFSKRLIEASFKRAQHLSGMDVDAVSPMSAAREITVPTLIIHGENDVETRPAHAQRIFNSLAGPKRLILVPGASHNRSLRGDLWLEIDAWILAALMASGGADS